MIDAIQTHVLDILQTGLTSLGLDVRRPADNGSDTVADGAVNLFDHARDEQPFCPAVFLGEKGLEAEDDEDFEAINSVRVQFRVLRQPLVIIASGVNLRAAKLARGQLVNKILAVLLQHPVESGYWYDLELGKEKLKQAATEGGGQGKTEATATLMLLIRYSRSPSTLI